jgi:hypothetical protein
MKSSISFLVGVSRVFSGFLFSGLESEEDDLLLDLFLECD